MEHYLYENLCLECSNRTHGLCCYHYMEFHKRKFIMTKYPCEHLDLETKKCTCYENRFEINPNCQTIKVGLETGSLPIECLYLSDEDRKDEKKWKRFPTEEDGFHANAYYEFHNHPPEEIKGFCDECGKTVIKLISKIKKDIDARLGEFLKL